MQSHRAGTFGRDKPTECLIPHGISALIGNLVRLDRRSPGDPIAALPPALSAVLKTLSIHPLHTESQKHHCNVRTSCDQRTRNPRNTLLLHKQRVMDLTRVRLSQRRPDTRIRPTHVALHLLASLRRDISTPSRADFINIKTTAQRLPVLRLSE